MNEEEFVNLTEEQRRAIPWNEPGIHFVEGRYYYGLGTVKINPGKLAPFGADVMACLWRFDNEPTTWRIQIRSRRYAGPNTDPWGDQDRKDWMAGMSNGSEEENAVIIKQVLKGMADGVAAKNGSAAEPPDWIIFRGDHSKVFKMLRESSSPWLNKKTVTRPA